MRTFWPSVDVKNRGGIEAEDSKKGTVLFNRP